MVIKCEKKTIEESLGQRKLNIRGNKETRAMRPWKEGPGWQGSQQTLFLSCLFHFFSNTQVERPHRTQGLEGAKEKTVSGKQENKAARLQAPCDRENLCFSGRQRRGVSEAAALENNLSGGLKMSVFKVSMASLQPGK